MKRSYRLKVASGFLALFLAITYLTAHYESPCDGNDLVGWPFPFYEYLGGKRDAGAYRENGFILKNLLLDAATALGIAIGIIHFLTSAVKSMSKQRKA